MKRIVINQNGLFKVSISLLTIAFVLFYFSDGVGKMVYRSGAGYTPYSAILKGFFEIVILLYAIVTLRKAKATIIFAIFLLLVSFLIGQFFLSLSFKELDFAENFSTLFKYLFPFIFYLLALDIMSYKEYPDKLLKYYKIIISLNSILIVLGAILSITYFKTYRGIHRFGYDGLIFAQNEASFIFIFAITTVYYRRFYLGIKEKFFWIVLLPSLIVATKAVYVFVILLFFFHLIKRVPLKRILAFGISIFVMGYLIFSTAINDIFINSYQVFMYELNKGGLLHALLSGRDAYIKEKLSPLILEHWSLPNIFFGGQDVVAHYIEMGFFDLLLFFGLFGAAFYSYFFFKLFNLIPFKRDFKIFFGFSLLIIIGTAGHFFESGIAGIHFIFLLLINKNYKAKDLPELKE